MIDDQVNRNQGIDLLGVAAQIGHGVAHHSQIDYGGYAGKILHYHSRRFEGNLFLARSLGTPACNALDIFTGNLKPVALPERGL